jgi:hypothetical protein
VNESPIATYFLKLSPTQSIVRPWPRTPIGRVTPCC